MRRRDALKHAGYAAGLFGLSADAGAATAPPMPDRNLLTSDPEQYWRRLRADQFFLPDWRAFLNNGSLGVAPKLVVAAVADSLASGATLDKDEYPRWGYETLDE